MSAAAEVTDTARDRIDAAAIDHQCILTLYKQVPNSAVAAGVVTIFMVFTAWTYSPHPVVIAWLVVQLATQVARFGLLAVYRRRAPQGEALKPWALAYTLYMLVAGVMWGSTIFLFSAPAQPVSISLTLCGLYGISAGSTPGNAYNLPGCYAFVVTIFIMVLLKMLMLGDFGHIVLGLASALFALIMVLFARVQNRVLRDGFAIRFENIHLLAETQRARERAEVARRQAEAANLAKSQFLAAASHDLRQPLYALSLFSGALKSLELADDATQVVTHIQDNIAAMEGLFNGLLDLSRLEAGAVKSVRRPFALQPMFDRLEHILMPQARGKGLRLRLRPSALWVMADEVLTEQILVNLIANALRYTHAGGVVVGARRRGAGIVLQVWDSGEGIAEDDRQRIFQEFVQIGNAERDRRKGLGLGLAIAARTAELLDTTIELDSQFGRGSRFGFALPQAEPQAVTVAPMIAGAAPIARLRVLIVDDDPAVREALSLLLKGWGVTYTIVEDTVSAQTALDKAALEGPPYQVVLSDHRLREGHAGLDFLAGLKARAPRPGEIIPGLALVTGDVDPELMRRVGEAEIFLIHKPVDPARLRALLNHLAST